MTKLCWHRRFNINTVLFTFYLEEMKRETEESKRSQILRFQLGQTVPVPAGSGETIMGGGQCLNWYECICWFPGPQPAVSSVGLRSFGSLALPFIGVSYLSLCPWAVSFPVTPPPPGRSRSLYFLPLQWSETKTDQEKCLPCARATLVGQKSWSSRCMAETRNS